MKFLSVIPKSIKCVFKSKPSTLLSFGLIVTEDVTSFEAKPFNVIEPDVPSTSSKDIIKSPFSSLKLKSLVFIWLNFKIKSSPFVRLITSLKLARILYAIKFSPAPPVIVLFPAPPIIVSFPAPAFTTLLPEYGSK